jgi:hypothetical protein
VTSVPCYYECTSITLLRLLRDATILDGFSSIVAQQCKQAVVGFHSNVFCCLETSVVLELVIVPRPYRLDVYVCSKSF